MRRMSPWTGAACLTAALTIGAAAQQQGPPTPFVVGNPVGLPVVPAADGTFNPVSSNVKMFGAMYSGLAFVAIR